MTDHDVVAAQYAAAIDQAHAAYARHYQSVAELTVLRMAHLALSVDPDSDYVWLEETDQDGDHMTFWCIATHTGRIFGSNPGLGDTQEEEISSDLIAQELETAALDLESPWLQNGQHLFWIEQGSRKMGSKGQLLVTKAIEVLTPKYRPVLDPMPTDPVALKAWLDTEES